MELPCRMYICHYTPLVERKKFFEKQCGMFNLQGHQVFLEENDREKISPTDLKHFGTTKLTMNEISLFLKHLDGMKMIRDSNNDYGIIMEDDCIFKPGFLQYLMAYLKNLPNEFDIIYAGFFPFLVEYKRFSGQDHPISGDIENVNNYFFDMTNKIVFPWTGNNKGTDFYIISKNCCSMFLDKFKKNDTKIEQPIDHFMGTFLSSMKAIVYWTSKDIIEHGSLSIFQSSIR